MVMGNVERNGIGAQCPLNARSSILDLLLHLNFHPHECTFTPPKNEVEHSLRVVALESRLTTPFPSAAGRHPRG
jgi:hypothetical protein